MRSSPQTSQDDIELNAHPAILNEPVTKEEATAVAHSDLVVSLRESGKLPGREAVLAAHPMVGSGLYSDMGYGGKALSRHSANSRGGVIGTPTQSAAGEVAGRQIMQVDEHDCGDDSGMGIPTQVELTLDLQGGMSNPVQIPRLPIHGPNCGRTQLRTAA